MYNNFAMEVVEVNRIAVNNLPISDELNVINQDTEYAKKRRGKKIKTVSIIAIASFSTILLGGTLLTNAFIGDDPVIKASQYESFYLVENNILTYSFEVEKLNSNLKFQMRLFKDKTIIEKVDITEVKVYEGSYELEYEKNYKLDFYVTNNFDYTKSIHSYNIYVKMEE